MTSEFSLQSRNISFEKNEEIRITKRTVTFGYDVYQLRNIVGFSEGDVKTPNVIPGQVLWFSALAGLALTFIPGTSQIIGAIAVMTCFFGFLINVNRPNKYGLLLTLNSGDKHLFVTAKKAQVREVIMELYRFMEMDEEGVQVITVTDNSITIHGSLTGIAAAGNKKSNLSNEIR